MNRRLNVDKDKYRTIAYRDKILTPGGGYTVYKVYNRNMITGREQRIPGAVYSNTLELERYHGKIDILSGRNADR